MKHAKHRATGGVNEAAEDLKSKNERYTYQSHVNDEAEERKHGGRAKRKRGGHVMHEGYGPEHEATSGRAKRKHGGHVKHVHMGHVKHVGAIHGEHGAHHAGRKPRKSGGRATSDANPFTSARHGTPPKGRNLDMEME